VVRVQLVAAKVGPPEGRDVRKVLRGNTLLQVRLEEGMMQPATPPVRTGTSPAGQVLAT